VYASSTDIRNWLDNHVLVLRGTPEHPLDLETQLQPSSVDVRIGDQFWVFRETVTRLDLLEWDQSRITFEALYEPRTLATGQYIELRHGMVLIGRLLEWLELPLFLAGKLEARSSCARLGLSIHCSGDYINPGYQGYMSVQLVNHNRFPIRVYPYLPLAQLVFVMVSSEPEASYQDMPDAQYVHDMGGPSRWYRYRNREL
jgi:deoxycytidine triphosphate deaminase